LRLFACACCRRVRQLLTPFAREALAVAERYSDGEVSEDKLRFAEQQAQREYQLAAGKRPLAARAIRAVAGTCEVDNPRLTLAMSYSARCDPDPASALGFGVAYARQMPLLHDIFGNPFRPVAADPSWLTSDVVALASQVYESRDFSAMP